MYKEIRILAIRKNMHISNLVEEALSEKIVREYETNEKVKPKSSFQHLVNLAKQSGNPVSAVRSIRERAEDDDRKTKPVKK